MIRVLVWARPAITRAGLEAIVRADPRFEVAGLGARHADLSTAVRQFTPDVVLLDVAENPISRLLPGLSDPPASRQFPSPAFVVLQETAQRIELRRALQTGVRAVLARDAHPAEITAALEAPIASQVGGTTPASPQRSAR